MSKYGKEIVIGVVPVLIAFLLFLGVNIIPIVFMAAFLGAFVYMTECATA